MYGMRLAMTTLGKYCSYCCSLSFYCNHFTCLVGAPLVAAGAPPARRHAGSATAATTVSKAAARPSTATQGCRAVSQDPAGCWGLFSRDLDLGDNTLDLLPCKCCLVFAARTFELVQLNVH